MTAMRPSELIDHELRAAEQLREHFEQQPTDDPLVTIMRDENEARLDRLRAEYAAAQSGSLEISLDGRSVTDHQIALPYLNRVTSGLQSSYRAIVRSLLPEGQSAREAGTLTLAATGPGSFRLSLKGPVEPLNLLEPPVSDRALDVMVTLLKAVTNDESGQIEQWAASAPEPALRSMIRLASTLASSGGTTQVRWRAVDGREQIAVVPFMAARRLASALAGQTGTEILVVTGHLGMAQDSPPRIRVSTAEDQFVADVKDEELLELVKELLFSEVEATLSVSMHTSQTTGAPSSKTELLDLQPNDASKQPHA